ncbi:MAG TPA: glycosyltransferase family 9 protein [Candidatus Binatus sp.]|nr:glycosyltransferase family 9 protein [Candidatus Binatus sp.]
MRLLIVLPGAIGDVVRALPLLGRVRRGTPGATLGWAVEPPSAPVLAGHPWLDRLHVFERRRGARAIAPFLGDIRAAGYEVALDLGRGLKSGLIARLSRARLRIGFHREDGREGSWLFANRYLPRQGTARPKLVQFLAFGDALGLPPAEIEFGLAPTDAEVREAAAMTAGLEGPLVAACLGSSCSSRRWFPGETAAVLRTLRARHGAAAVLLGTPMDASFAAAVRGETDGAVCDLVGRTTLRQLLAILARARLAFGPDSGALHLAAAVGTPVVSLWGATSPARSVPFGCDALAVSGSAPCAPCFLTTCPIGRVCMRAISVEAVVARAAGVLAGGEPVREAR